jgi:calcium-dependent protein kinase
VKRDDISEKDTANILKHILGALNYCHKKGIVHRDIKPQNVVMDGSEGAKADYSRLKIVDFGVSGKIKEEKMPSFTGSTREFMPPEMHLNGCKLNGNYN